MDPAVPGDSLGLNSHVACAADEVVGGGLALCEGHHFHRVGLVVGTEDEVPAGQLHVFHGAAAVLVDRIHVGFALAVGFEGVVMAVDENGGTGEQAGVHAHTLAAIHLDEHKALPVVAVTFHFGTQLAQETLLELQDFLHPHARDEGFGGGDSAVDQEYVLELVPAGWQDTGALVDLAGIEQIQNGEALHVQHLVHAFNAEAALAVQKVGDVRLFEAGLLGQAEAGQVPLFDARAESFAQVVLQHFEFHAGEYSTGLIASRYLPDTHNIYKEIFSVDRRPVSALCANRIIHKYFRSENRAAFRLGISAQERRGLLIAFRYS